MPAWICLVTNKRIPIMLGFLLRDITFSARYLQHPVALRNRLSLYSSVSRLRPLSQLTSIAQKLKGVHISQPLIPHHLLKRISDYFLFSESSTSPCFTVSYGRKALIFNQANFDKYVLPVLNEFILPYISSIFGDLSFSFVDCQAWQNLNIISSKWGVYSENWHVDNIRGDALKLFIPLHDVSINHGPTIILGPDDTKLAFRAGYIDRTSIGSLDALIHCGTIVPIAATCQLGAFYIFNPSYCLHRASIPKPNFSRSVLQLILYPDRDNNLNLQSAGHKLSSLDRYLLLPSN
jgi:hypothetical protein